MGKIIRKFSYIMLGNLLVFLAIGHLLDTFLESGSKYKMIFLILSVVSLIFFSKKFFKKALKDMEEISPIIEKNNKSESNLESENNKQNKNEPK